MTGLVALPLLVVHVVFGWSLAALARRMGERRWWWAWVPVLNLLLPFALARRSLLWAALLAVPPLNLMVWVLAWAEAFTVAGRRPWLGALMALPGLNLVVPAHVAGESPRRLAGALLLAAASLAVAGAARRQAVEAQVAETVARLQAGGLDERRLAARSLGDAARNGAVVPALSAALNDGDAEVRRQAAGALERLGRSAAGAAGALGELVQREQDPVVRGQAARALVAAGPADAATPDTVVPALLDAARGAGEREMPDVVLVDALGAAGPGALPVLRSALADPDPGVRWHAAAAFMQLGPRAPGVAPDLLRAMDDPAWPVRNAAGRALEDVAQAADVPVLAGALRAPSAETRYHVARALSRVGPAAAPAVPVLIGGLRDEDWEVRLECARALAAVGVAARESFPALEDALASDLDPQVRAAAAGAISVVGVGAPAEDALQRALDDPVLDVRRAARAALAWRRRFGARATS